MGPVEAAIIITVCLYWAVSRSRAEYGHVRDKHLGQIQKDHPDWSPRRQRRLAKHRARGYWAHQIGNGFPDMRNAFKENRQLAQVERAEAEAAGAKRWADYRKRLEAAHAEREKYVADQVSKDPATDKTKTRKAWFDRRKLAGALRAGATATKLELGNARRPAATAPEPAARQPTDPTGTPVESDAWEPQDTTPPTSGQPQSSPVRQCLLCGAEAAFGRRICAGCKDLNDLRLRIDALKRHRDASCGAERACKDAEIRNAENELDDLQRAADSRKVNGGRAPEPVYGQVDASGRASATSAQRWRCERGGKPADKLYPMAGPDGAAQAVCGTCAEGGNCGATNGQPGSRACDRCRTSFDLSALAWHPDGRLLCGPCADAEAATPGSPGDQADPVYATDEPATTDSPSTEGGADQHTNPGGIPVEAPSFEAAVAAATAEAENLRQREVGVEQFIADLLAGGMGNDQETINHFAQAQEFLASARAAFQAGVQSMGKHQQGVEYADTGHAAKTEWLATK